MLSRPPFTSLPDQAISARILSVGRALPITPLGGTDQLAMPMQCQVVLGVSCRAVGPACHGGAEGGAEGLRPPCLLLSCREPSSSVCPMRIARAASGRPVPSPL